MKPIIEFSDMKDNVISDVIDFGTIPAGSKKEIKIQVKNTGDVQLEDMIIKTDSEHVSVVCSNSEIKPLQKITITLVADIPEDVSDPIRPKISVGGKYFIS